MNCALSIKQQQLLLKKVAADLSGMADFDFGHYAKEVFDQVNGKTGDPVLAATYVGLLPTNIIAARSNKTLRQKFIGIADELENKERDFENFDSVQNFVNGFNAAVTAEEQVQKDVQEASLTKQPEQQESGAEPVEALQFSDIAFPERMNDLEQAFYFDAKTQLAANAKPDGTSEINGVPVKVTIIQAKDFRLEDHYPDVQRQAEQLGDKLKTGVVLAVTDLKGEPIRFNESLEKDPQGRIVHYKLRAPNEDLEFNKQDRDEVDNLVKSGMDKDQAEAGVRKKLDVIRKVREHVSKGNTVGVTINQGLGAKWQYSKVEINKPNMPVDLVNKLIELMTTDVKIRKGGQTYDYPMTERLKLLSQFFYANEAVFNMSVDDQGQLVVRKYGKEISLDSQQLADELRQEMTKWIPLTPVSPAQAKEAFKSGRNRVQKPNLKFARLNDIYEDWQPDNTVNYYKVGVTQLKIDHQAFKNNLYQDFTIVDGLITVSKKPYYPFVQQHFKVKYEKVGTELKPVAKTTDYPPIATLGLSSFAPYVGSGQNGTRTNVYYFDIDQPQPVANLGLQIAADELVKIAAPVEQPAVPVEGLFDKEGNFNENFVPTETKPMSAKEKLLSIRKTNPAKFNKMVGQNGLEATIDQIDSAQAWYEASSLSRIFPFETMFDLVNQEDSNSIATWTSTGIVLWKGADYSDLYHEAWHGFTQGLMSIDQKTAMYKELRRKKGMFADYRGEKVSFQSATDLQLEEFLAEDFREYMLSGGKTVLKESPVRNSFFARLWNFLKALFGDQTVIDALNERQINNTISELYNKLRVGDLQEYTFSEENRNFDTLNKSLTAIRKEKQDSLSYENSQLVYDSINSLFSEAVDALNKANLDDQLELQALKVKAGKTEADRRRMKELDAQISSSYTTTLFSTKDGLRTLYDYAKSRLEEKMVEFAQIDTPDAARKTELLGWMIRNFGDVENLELNRPDEGVIGYHIYKSDLVDISLKDELLDELELSEREVYGKEYFDRGGNERSIYDMAAKEIRNLIKTLHRTDINGNEILNELGFAKPVSFRETFAYIARTVQNSKDLQDMYNRLQAEQKNYGPIKQLLDKLGELEYPQQTDREVILWSKFFQTFNKYRVPLIQTTVVETWNYDKETGDRQPNTYEIRIGNALADTVRIDQDWRSEFQKAGTSAMVKNDIQGNYLDLERLFKTYPNVEKVNNKPFEFLRDIGIALADLGVMREQLDKAISSGEIRLSGIYLNLQNLNVQGYLIRDLSTFLRHNLSNGVIGQTGPNSNYGKILQLQSRYSGEYSDFMVQNAAGDPQSEYTQNNSLTQLVKQINAVKDYNELVNNPTTAHYNMTKAAGRPYNPFVNSSIWMRSLFNMDQHRGPRYEGNEMVIDNLSGVNSSINDNVFEEGVALSQADEIGKLLNDFHIQLMRGTPELTRHAGKKTSLAVYLRKYKTGAKNSRLYVDTENFVTEKGEFNQGFDEFYEIVKHYIGAELERTKYAAYLLNNADQADFKYLERGTKFVAFGDVLSSDMQERLHNLKKPLVEELDANPALSDELYKEVQKYFYGLVSGVNQKLSAASFISPNLIEKTRIDSKKKVDDGQVRSALAQSFVANNWIHHFEEMIVLYGDIALYKDFFKRNASLNSTGDIIRNDQPYQHYVNARIGKPFAEKQGVPEDIRTWNGVLNVSVSSDVLTKSVYLKEYQEAIGSPVVEKKYGEEGINEADAQGLVAFDTYRILLKGIGKWSDSQEQAFQDILKGKPLSKIDVPEFFPVLKMGHFGPMQIDGLPLMALHKFALMPLIPGLSENLDKLHQKMMAEGIDYHTFESGSKVATVTDRSGLKPFYSDLEKREINDQPFVKNRVFVEYLKYQVEGSSKYKGKMTLPTQLRKLVDIGLTDDNLRQTYLDSLKALVEHHKNELLSDIGWRRNKDGKLVGSMDSLLRMISDELKRSDVGEHEWMYIQTIKTQDIKNSIDVSQSAEIIEKVIVALVNKRLINFKVKGEQLVMVSSTGFENKGFAYGESRNFEKPTDEDLHKYGTNDLPTYHVRDGRIQAAKVKIALQGDFKKLLNLQSVKDKAIELKTTPFDALNLLIKDDRWLDIGDHRKMVSMIGARIPTQGMNSIDFVEVYEFLPEIAGNIIIAPSEVTSKMGSDNDYDKLPLMMPHIRDVNGEVELAKPYTKELARQVYDQLLKAEIDKASFVGLSPEEKRMLLRGRFTRYDQTVKGISNFLWSSYVEELAEIIQEDILGDFDTFYDKFNGTAVLENDLQQAMRKIVERPDNFAQLVRPNDTDMVQPLAEEIRKNTAANKKKGTRMFEPLHNLDVQQSNSVGKDALGIGAKANTMNAVFQSLGVYLNTVFEDQYERSFDAKLLFKHNKKNDGISLSNQVDALNENNIAEVVSQLINGWVDVEKDDWVSYIQGNKQVAPIMLFMVRAGVPIKDIVKFVTSPVVKDYVAEQRLAKSAFSKVLGLGNGKNYRKIARNQILAKYGFFGLNDSDIELLTDIYTEGITNFADLNFEPGLEISTGTEQPLAAFLHYLQIERLSNEVARVERAFSMDTDTLQSLTEFHAKTEEVKGLLDQKKPLIGNNFIQALIDRSPIGPFYVQGFALEIFGKVMPLRNHPVVNEFLAGVGNNDLNTLWDVTDEDSRVAFHKTFKNDLLSYIFQQQIRGFDESLYKQKFDNDKLLSDYKSEAYVKEGPGAIKHADAFTNFNEYRHFIYEREKLREIAPKEIVPELELEKYDGEYEDWLRDKTLFRIFSPYQLFRADRGVSAIYTEILNDYPQLKSRFSILNNIKVSNKDGYSNLLPSTIKWDKDEIDIFHENLKDLATSTKLVEAGLEQPQADYISSFFKRLPLYLYMQAGPNTRNPFSFARMLPQEKILSVMEEPVKWWTKNITEQHLKEFLPLFVVANANKTTRNRFKDFLPLDKEATTTQEKDKEMQLDLFEKPVDKDVSNHSMSYKMPAAENLTGVDTTTVELAEQGKRTATTRSYPLGNVGDIITFEGRPQQYMITNLEQLTETNTKDPNWINQWSEKEQWTADHFNKVLGGKTVHIGSWQTSFEKVDEDNGSTAVSYSTSIITRDQVQANPRTLYLFGDNDIRAGLGGQAKEMRGEPNTIGIITKKRPDNNSSSFLTDEEYEENVHRIRSGIDTAIALWKFDEYDNIVIPPIGVGLAKLPEKAPRTYAFLLSEFKRLEKELSEFVQPPRTYSSEEVTNEINKCKK